MEDRTKLYKNILLPLVLKHIPTAQVYLFGSRARGDYVAGSDIDVAIDAGSAIDRRILLAIKQEIEDSSIPVFVDVVDVWTVSDRMRNTIKKDWILWNE